VGAAMPVSQTVGTAGITSTTYIVCDGTVTQSDSLTWVQTNDPNGVPPLNSATVDAGGLPASVGSGLTAAPGETGQIRYTAGYNANIVAVHGSTVLTKSVGINTGNQIADHNNIETNTLLTYIATDEAGQAVGSEDILIDATGGTTSSGAMAFNPFGTQASGLFPPFSTTVNAGSSFNILRGTIDTAASGRFISASGDVPIGMAYSITGRGITSSSGTTPAIGTMSAFMTAHLQEGVIVASPGGTAAAGPFDIGLGSDLQYASSVSASGAITSFSQAYSYNSVG
jgi:hypothetical protein